jgi:hypothetical protein
MVCFGAPRMEDRFDDVTSIYSSEGTAAHTVRERCLTEGIDVQDLVGEWIPADDLFFEVTPEWVAHLQPGIDRIRESRATWVFEHRVTMDPWIPGGFGTLDAGGIAPKEITIDDLKFGAGVPVDAEGNKQEMIYGLGFWKNYAQGKTNATEFLLRIDQPRVAGRGSEWRVSLEDMLKFGEEVEAAVERVAEADAADEADLLDYLHPTVKGCQFCRAARNSGCRKLNAFVLDLLGLEFTDLTTLRKRDPKLADIDEMTPERRSYVLMHKQLISSWLSNLSGTQLDEALRGGETPGFKAVATLGDRTWTDEAEAEAYWRGKIPDKDLYTRNMKSPAQLEIIAGTRNWKKAEHLIHRPDGRPALVPVSDKRDALIPLVNLLEDLDLDDNDDDLLGRTLQPELDDLI